MWSNSNCKRDFPARQKRNLSSRLESLMCRKKRIVRSLVVAGSVLGSAAVCAQTVPAPELPRPSVEVPGITPEVLSRTAVPGAPWKLAIATRVTYEPGARVRKHYHTSQVVFYILEGGMVVQDDGKEPTTLKPGDSLLIKPGTVHAHWNASTTAKLLFTEFILVDEGQRSAVFVRQ
jgi:quercetin dioxygenase-like cupin family protein